MNERPIALITGAGKRRVGAVVAEILAKAGFDIAVHYRTSATDAAETVERLREFGGLAEAFSADLRSESEVKSLVKSVQQKFGRIDALVNCAAIWQPRRLEEVTAADVLENFNANTLSTFLCCQHVGLLMVEQPTGGAIVNVGDWATARPYLNYAAYFASKGAIETLTRTFAVELASRNARVRVNCLLPGPVMLPPSLTEVERREAIAGTLVQKEGNPRHIAQAALQFITNDFITGACLPVDGGRTLGPS